MSIPTLAAVITAAGSSARFSKGIGCDVKKEYLPIDGHSVLYMATRPFYEIPSLKAVVVTCPEGSEDEAAVALEDLIDIASVPLLIIKGGATRMESVRAALEALKGVYFGAEDLRTANPQEFIFLNKMHSPIKKIQGRVRYQVLMRLQSARLLPQIYDLAVRCSNSSALVYVEENPVNLS